jgi:hypothetical protein
MEIEELKKTTMDGIILERGQVPDRRLREEEDLALIQENETRFNETERKIYDSSRRNAKTGSDSRDE